MTIYVAEINGEALIAFRADDEEEARAMADDDEGDVRTALLEVVRVDGTPLWDGSSDIVVRVATDTERAQWDAEADGDSDEFEVFLIPVYDPEGPDAPA
jgi:hypothetical protein